MKVKTKRYGVVHQIAFCKECDWREEDYRIAQKEARKHTEKTGHSVAVETGIAYDYYI